jgi:hypothetical protein
MEFRYDLVPGHGLTFDVAALEQRLAAMPGVLDHTGAQRQFLFCGTIQNRERLERAIRNGEAVSFELLGVVVIHPHRICVHQMATERVLAQLQAFLTPVIEEYQCRVQSATGGDVTPDYEGRWHALFGAPRQPADR